MALDVAGSIDALFADDVLLAEALEAASEGRALADRIGKVAVWASLLTRFLGPMTLKAALALGRLRSPEAVAYVEEHFGRKLHAQHVRMGEEIAALAAEKGTPHRALD